MTKIIQREQQLIKLFDDQLVTWLDAFIRSRKAMGVAPGTVRFYHQKLKPFLEYCHAFAVDNVSQVTSVFIRDWMLHLEDTGHNPGGIHSYYRPLKTFLFWYETEVEPDNWKNPIKKVKPPRLPTLPLDPVSTIDIQKMLCVKRDTFCSIRDDAILLCLLDTGARAHEFLNINMDDINQVSGEILIRKGKGSKPRYVFIGKKSRLAVRKYLKLRQDNCHALWVKHPSCGADRLDYFGLRSIITRRAKLAGIPVPSLHSFRRAFALSMLRSGTDVFTLAKLMGHEGISILQRYLKQTNADTEAAHRKSSPADGL
jgi:integrase/recombinase XerD